MKSLQCIRHELDNLILEKARPLCLPGKDLRMALDGDITIAMREYATSLCEYLVGEGIPAIVNYNTTRYNSTSKWLMVSDSGRSWHLDNYVLDVDVDIIGPTLWLGMSSQRYVYVSVDFDQFTMTMGSSTSVDTNDLVMYLLQLIDQIKGSHLCVMCHYSSRVEWGKIFCGKGMVGTAYCNGYRDK